MLGANSPYTDEYIRQRGLPQRPLPGGFNLEIYQQDHVWYDIHANLHFVAEIDDEYALNILMYSMRRWPQIDGRKSPLIQALRRKVLS